jgi:hypothetical protein
VGSAQQDNFPLSQETGQETVSTAALSECIGKADIQGRALLKLDVQGYELAALQGCADLLGEFDFVYVEASFIELYVGQALASEIIAFLLARNFRLLSVANLAAGKAPRPIQGDFLFGRNALNPTAQTNVAG